MTEEQAVQWIQNLFQNPDEPQNKKDLNEIIQQIYGGLVGYMKESRYRLINSSEKQDIYSWDYTTDGFMEFLEIDPAQNRVHAPSPYHAALYLRRIQEKFRNEGKSFLFRGQGDYGYDLVPAFFREDTHPESESMAVNLFANILFFSNYGNYQNFISSPEIHLATAQHYGLKTKLLDVTLDPFVAVWFANREWKLERKSDMAAVYIIKPEEISHKAKVKMPPHYCYNLYNELGLFLELDSQNVGFSHDYFFSVTFPQDPDFSYDFLENFYQGDLWLYYLASWCRYYVNEENFSFPQDMDSLRDIMMEFDEFLASKNIQTDLAAMKERNFFDQLLEKGIDFILSFCAFRIPNSKELTYSKEKLEMLASENAELIYAISSFSRISNDSRNEEFEEILEEARKLSFQKIRNSEYTESIESAFQRERDPTMEYYSRKSILEVMEKLKQDDPDSKQVLLTEANFKNELLKYAHILGENDASGEADSALEEINMMDMSGLLALAKEKMGEEEFKELLAKWFKG